MYKHPKPTIMSSLYALEVLMSSTHPLSLHMRAGVRWGGHAAAAALLLAAVAEAVPGTTSDAPLALPGAWLALKVGSSVAWGQGRHR